ncbi:MAG: hypothetical protein IT519_16815 [Burkholderiales bacterium]|nr:hypothetical protein [Burkholderiales bacterium]
MQVILVSRDEAVRDSLAAWIGAAGLAVESYAGIGAWLEAARRLPDACPVLDAGSDLLAEQADADAVAALCARRPVLLLVDRGDVPAAVRAMKGGAHEVFEKPCRDASLLLGIERIVADRRSAAATG